MNETVHCVKPWRDFINEMLPCVKVRPHCINEMRRVVIALVVKDKSIGAKCVAFPAGAVAFQCNVVAFGYKVVATWVIARGWPGYVCGMFTKRSGHVWKQTLYSCRSA